MGSLLKNIRFRKISFCLVVVVVLGCIYSPLDQSRADDTKHEEQIGRKFAKQAALSFAFIQDEEALEYLRAIGNRISSSLDNRRFPYHFFLIKDNRVNAFAVPGGYIYVFSGLVLEASNSHELAGVLAHEIGHIQGRHFLKRYKKNMVSDFSTFAVTVLSAVFLPPKEGVAIAAGAQAANLSHKLSYSREQEREADLLGVRYAAQAGFDPKGVVTFFQKLGSPTEIPPYLLTHPIGEDRTGHAFNLLNIHSVAEPHWKDNHRFEKVQTIIKLETFDKNKVIEEYEQALRLNPGDPLSNYLLGIVYMSLGISAKSRSVLERAVELDPSTAAYRADLGKVYIQLGKFDLAREALTKGLEIDTKNLQLLINMGQADEKEEKYPQALAFYKKALTYNPQAPSPQYHLGVIYGKMNKLGEAHSHLGSYCRIKGQYDKAILHFQKAQLEFGEKSSRGRKLQKEIDALIREAGW